MGRKTVALALLSAGVAAFLYVLVRFAVFVHSTSFVGIDLIGIWRMWGIRIVLWLVVMTLGVWLYRHRGSATSN